MKPDQLLEELGVILERSCAPVYNVLGMQEPLTREQWLDFKERVDLLCAAYTPREMSDDDRKPVRQQQA